MRQLELLLLIEKSRSILVQLCDMDQLKLHCVLFPDVTVRDVEHHHGDIFILVVVLLALVLELRLDLDEAVEGLVGHEGLVSGVQLDKEGGVGPVDDGLVLAGPGAGVGQVQELTSVELESLSS